MENNHITHNRALLGMWAILGLAVIFGLLAAVFARQEEKSATINSFAECAAKYPVMESYPRQCRTPDGRGFTEVVAVPPVPAEALTIRGSAADMVRNVTPAPNGSVSDPLVLSGEARGTMFFEATFPFVLLDGVGTKVAEGHVQANGEWMTEDFVPFSAVIPWTTKPRTSGGTLILKRDNPSGLPENDREAYVAVRFQGYETLPQGAD